MQYFLSCDWGTSNFRLRLVSIPNLEIVREEISEQGVAMIFERWQETKQGEEKRFEFYRNILKKHVSTIGKKVNLNLDNCVIIISGMASSSIGMINLPYKHIPFLLDGSDLITKYFNSTDEFKNDILIISGAQSEDDVMRGEETQLIGCIDYESEDCGDDKLFIHPGTHSKHMYVQNGKLTAFKTFMTGEFFKLLSEDSILSNSVEKGENIIAAEFEKGVKEADGGNILNAAFKVRTNDLFHKTDKEKNYQYLSGVIIGTELQEISKTEGSVFLCAGPSHSGFYKTAFSILGLSERVTVCPVEWEQSSVIRGQYKIYKSLKNEYP